MNEWKGVKLGELYRTKYAGRRVGVGTLALLIGFDPPEPGRKRLIELIFIQEGAVVRLRSNGKCTEDGTYNFGHELYVKADRP